MNAFVLRVLADVADGHVYVDGVGNVRVDPAVQVDPTDEPRYISIVRELGAAVDDVPAGSGLRRLRLVAPDGYESANALTYVAGVFEAVAR